MSFRVASLPSGNGEVVSLPLWLVDEGGLSTVALGLLVKLLAHPDWDCEFQLPDLLMMRSTTFDYAFGELCRFGLVVVEPPKPLEGEPVQ